MPTELDLIHREQGIALQSGAHAGLRPGLSDLSLLDLAEILLRARRLLFVVPMTLTAIVVSVSLLAPRTYTATASFMPQASKAPSPLAGIAAQFGLSVPMLESGQSPAFYADLIKSQAILIAVARGPYAVRLDGTTFRGPLMEIYRVRGSSEPRRLDRAIKKLDENITVETTQRTSIVTLAVRAQDARLASEIAQRILDEVNTFNLEKRASQARAERRFTEQRLAEVQGELRQSEDALESFLRQNRDYRNSPQLTFDQDRLSRAVSLHQQLYTSLAQALEQARIEEVRDTPVITVIQQPEAPARPDPRRLLLKGLAALFAGMIFGAIMTLGREMLSRRKIAEPDRWSELASVARDALNDLRHPWRLLRASRR